MPRTAATQRRHPEETLVSQTVRTEERGCPRMDFKEELELTGISKKQGAGGVQM